MTASPAFQRDLVARLPQMRAWAMRLTRNPTWAADLVQDVAERALVKSHLFQPGTNLDAWLYTMMRNCFITAARKAARGAAGPLEAAADVAAAALTPFEQAEFSETITALESLPDLHRRPLHLAAMGVRVDDAARIQGIAEGTAKSRLSRARAALSEMVA